MRVCPKCGYEDPHIWRPNRWRHETDFTSWADFQEFYPPLANELVKGEITTDSFYAYRRPLRARHIVERITLTLFKSVGKKGFHSTMEHVSHKQDPFQKKLVGVEE